jgi:hypothetical protein
MRQPASQAGSRQVSASVTHQYLLTDMVQSSTAQQCKQPLPSPTPKKASRRGEVWCGVVWYGVVWCGVRTQHSARLPPSTHTTAVIHLSSAHARGEEWGTLPGPLHALPLQVQHVYQAVQCMLAMHGARGTACQKRSFSCDTATCVS